MTVQLYLGDCLDFMRPMPDKSIDSVIADPPYGIDYQSARRTDKAQWKPKISNDKEPFLAWLPDAFRLTKDGGSLLCFCRWDVEECFRQEIKAVGYDLKSQVIWDKVIHGMGDLDGCFAPQHENIIFATKGDFSFHGRRPHTVIRAQRVQAEKMVHPNEKPILLFYKLIEAVVPKRATVLDCFFGSGASALAAHSYGVNYLGCDNDPMYHRIATYRLALAQQQPRLAGI